MRDDQKFSWGQKFYTLSARLACLWKSWPAWQRTRTWTKSKPGASAVNIVTANFFSVFRFGSFFFFIFKKKMKNLWLGRITVGLKKN